MVSADIPLSQYLDQDWKGLETRNLHDNKKVRQKISAFAQGIIAGVGQYEKKERPTAVRRKVVVYSDLRGKVKALADRIDSSKSIVGWFFSYFGFGISEAERKLNVAKNLLSEKQELAVKKHDNRYYGGFGRKNWDSFFDQGWQADEADLRLNPEGSDGSSADRTVHTVRKDIEAFLAYKTVPKNDRAILEKALKSLASSAAIVNAREDIDSESGGSKRAQFDCAERLADCAYEITKGIEKLAVGESFVWTSGDSGHQTILEVLRTHKDRFTIITYNTGDNVINDAVRGNAGGFFRRVKAVGNVIGVSRAHPQAIENVSLTEVTSMDFWPQLIGINRGVDRAGGKHQWSMEDHRKLIEQYFSRRGERLKKDYGQSYSLQKGNNCTHASLMAWLQNQRIGDDFLSPQTIQNFEEHSKKRAEQVKDHGKVKLYGGVDKGLPAIQPVFFSNYLLRLF